ncbi:hypothetical protein [Oceanobacillus halotolerans]|uniref:hypothetical protein n=1 Tax=Oceanobacillus halotolerans TaxID=2663380 RepID=UPI0013DA74AC|nr:hypothetical protein [Oceanobacillus halotolerans]
MGKKTFNPFKRKFWTIDNLFKLDKDSVVEFKKDMRELKTEFKDDMSELKEDMNKTKQEFHEDMGEVKQGFAEAKQEIAKNKGTFIGLTALAILGVTVWMMWDRIVSFMATAWEWTVNLFIVFIIVSILGSIIMFLLRPFTRRR